MPRRIPTAIRTANDAWGIERDGAVADAVAWRVPRAESRDGLAVRGGARHAGAKRKHSRAIAGSYRAGARAGGGRRGGGRDGAGSDTAAGGGPKRGRRAAGGS